MGFTCYPAWIILIVSTRLAPEPPPFQRAVATTNVSGVPYPWLWTADFPSTHPTGLSGNFPSCSSPVVMANKLWAPPSKEDSVPNQLRS